MITYNNATELLTGRIPEFISPNFIPEYPTLAYAHFADFVLRHILEENLPMISRCADLINELATTSDTEVIALVDEFVITLYTNDKGDKSRFLFFKERLQAFVQQIFEEIIANWNKQN
jgi:hypothetical protein